MFLRDLLLENTLVFKQPTNTMIHLYGTFQKYSHEITIVTTVERSHSDYPKIFGDHSLMNLNDLMIDVAGDKSFCL